MLPPDGASSDPESYSASADEDLVRSAPEDEQQEGEHEGASQDQQQEGELEVVSQDEQQEGAGQDQEGAGQDQQGEGEQGDDQAGAAEAPDEAEEDQAPIAVVHTKNPLSYPY